MPREFNPYCEWLGVDVPGQSPNYYQLLGVADFEANPESLWAAAYQRRALLRAQQYGEHADLAKRLLDEVDAAEACLLNPGRKTDYDRALRSGEAPPLLKASAARASSSNPAEKPDAGSKSRRERRLKPGEREPGENAPGERASSGKSDRAAKQNDPPPEVAEVPPDREPAADPIGEARVTGPKSAWGYDDGVPFHPEMPGSRPAAGQPPLAAPAPPMRPADFLPPPAAPSAFGAPAGFPPAGYAPQAGIPPGALPPAGWTPAGPPSAPLAGTVPTAAPGYAAPPPPYGAAPSYGAVPPYQAAPAQPGWTGAPLAAGAYPPGVVPAAPMAAPYGAAPMAAPVAGVPSALPMATAAPIAAAAPMAAPALMAAPAMSDDFDSQGPARGAAVGPVVSGASRKNFAKRPTPSVYALGAFLAVIVVGVTAIMVLRPPRDDRKVAHTSPDVSSEHKSSVVKTPVADPPSKTGDSDDPPGKTEAMKTEAMKSEAMKTEPKEPAKTEPMKTEPKEPSKEPMTKEKPKEKEPPKENAKPKEDAQRNELVTAALMSARYYLSERDVAKAKDMVALAKKNDADGKRQDEIEGVRLLAHYVGEFWKAVKDECKALDGGAALTIQGITIAYVEGNNDYVMFRRAGRNEKHYFFPSPNGPLMKTGLAQGLAELYLAKNNTVTNLIFGAFKAVNPTSDRSEAKQHFETVQSMGTDELKQTAKLMLPELAVTIPKEAPKLPSVPNTPSTPNPEPTEGKPKPPTGEALAKAQDAIKAKFKQQLAAAVFESDKAVAAEKLHAAAETEELDSAGKYALLILARDLAAEGRRPKLAMAIVADIDQHFTIDLLTLKVDTLAAAVKAAGDDADANKEIAQTAATLADDAALMEKFAPAIRLAGLALQAARKAKDPELLKQAVARDKEIRALKPGKT